MKAMIIGFFCLIVTKPKIETNTFTLISRPKTIIGCGGFLVAAEFFFINAKDSSSKIGIILCPDGYGDDFFKEDKNYEIHFSNDSIVPKGYNLFSTYQTDSIYTPKRLITEIKKSNW